MTSELGELFNAHKAARKQKRADNREKGADRLTRLGVEYEAKNMGAHLIVRHDGKVIDYWPGTGKWEVRGSNCGNRGIRKMLRYLGVEA